VPREWPWPGKSTAEILESLQSRVEVQASWTPSLSDVFVALFLGVGLTTLLSLAGAGPLLSAGGAVLGAIGLLALLDEFKGRKARRLAERLHTSGPRDPGPTSQEDAEDDEKSKKHNGLIREHMGWDHFILDPGEAEAMSCRVCGEVTEVVRNIPRRPGYISFLGGMAADHDLFLCRHRDEAWHRQALDLMMMAEKTPSRTIQQELEKEVQTVLATRQPTKSSWSGGPRTVAVTG
jgi:hypothetical protein